jgi:hypothetical protein
MLQRVVVWKVDSILVVWYGRWWSWSQGRQCLLALQRLPRQSAEYIRKQSSLWMVSRSYTESIIILSRSETYLLDMSIDGDVR